MRALWVIGALVAAHLFLLCSAQHEALVETPDGPIQGLVSRVARTFYAIPYAMPPVGTYRWKSPVQNKPWTSTLMATRPGPGCPQNCSLPPHLCPPEMSEDCLTLDVYTPRLENMTRGLLPVLVFIHGGSFTFGYSGGLYEAPNLASKGGLVVVSIQYRLGVLGFLYDGTGSIFKGNYGFEDQQLALAWVQRNIKSFGGDPGRVTIWGQSAGGASVACHLIAPSSRGLFHRAIMSSNPISAPLKSPTSASKVASAYFKAVGCSATDLNCNLGKSKEEVTAAAMTASEKFYLLHPLQIILAWSPIVSPTSLVPKDIIPAFDTGEFTKVPLMIGALEQDAHMFVYLAKSTPMGSAAYLGVLALMFTTGAPKVSAKYPPSLFSGKDHRPLLGHLGTAYMFVCPARVLVRSMMDALPGSVYFFHYNHSLSFDGWGPKYPFCRDLVCHGAELPLAFDSPVLGTPGLVPTPDEVVLSNEMIKYTANFAYSGNPSKGIHVPLLPWQAYNKANLTSLVFETPKNSLAMNIWYDECDFWDKMGYNWGW